jgi:hypothetical protein
MNSEKDISFKSISLLKNNFFSLRKRPIWVPDLDDQDRMPHFENQKEIDALLMGFYYERIFQLEHWPTNSFNLFCLSPQIKKILVEVFHFEAESIGSISRYELFANDAQRVEPFNFSKDTQFFYAGRLSAQKNIEFVIFVIFHLQIFYSSQIKLTLIGDFDNEYHHDVLGCQYIDYQFKINSLIESLPWPGEKPTILKGFDQTEWLDQIPGNSIFFSASNLISEDFSVTAAQLQIIGKPQLLPNWGGFIDVRGDNIFHYHEEYIANSHEALSTINSKSKLFAQKLLKGTLLNKLPIVTKNSIIPSKSITHEYIKYKIEENRQIYGNEIDLIINKEFPSFVKTNIGQKIIINCRNILRNREI